MRDPKLVAGRGIEISVEHAIAVAELELEAGAFPDLQRGAAKVLDDFVDGEAGQLRGRARLRRDLDGLLDDRRRLGPRRAAGEEDERSEC